MCLCCVGPRVRTAMADTVQTRPVRMKTLSEFVVVVVTVSGHCSVFVVECEQAHLK
jgi:hypothetical protein